MDTPTIKRKVGAMRSVKVRPFHLVCRSVEKTCSSLPGKLTMIMAAIVNPRIVSSEIKREVPAVRMLIYAVSNVYVVREFKGYSKN